MINSQHYNQLSGHKLLEPFVGELDEIQFDLSGPFYHVENGKMHAEVSIDAMIIGCAHHMTIRYHVSRMYDRRETNAPFKLRPAEIEDELDSGYTSIEDICPSYHQNYDVRRAMNSYLTWLLQENSERFTKLLVA